MPVDISQVLANAQPSGIPRETGSATEQTLIGGQKNLASSFSSFLTLLTAQLKNQDPTAPLDTNNFTQQLVQMTGVQQQLLSNTLLNQMVSQKDDSGYDAVALIGRTATAQREQSQLASGKADWEYELPSNAAKVNFSIVNAAGQTVWTGKAPDISAGRHPFQWDGKDNTGKQLADGTYSLKIFAEDGAGEPLDALAYVKGVVASVEHVGGETLVRIGPTKVPLSSIVEVTA